MSAEKKEERVAARLVIEDVYRMTPTGLKDIVEWLQEQASFILSRRNDLGRRYEARYLVPAWRRWRFYNDK